MKRIIPIVIALTIVFSFAAEKSFPKFTLTDLSGGTIALDSILAQQKPIVITFWATWCKPCKKELRKLHEYWESWDTTKGERPYIIAALCEDGPRSVRQAKTMAKKEGWDKFILPYDKGGTVRKKAGVADIPECFILMPNGNIVYHHIGFNPGDEKKTIEILEKSIEEIEQDAQDAGVPVAD